MTKLWTPPSKTKAGIPILRPTPVKRAKSGPVTLPTDVPPGMVLKVVLDALQVRHVMPECLKGRSGKHRYAGHPHETATCVHCGTKRPEYRMCQYCAGFEPLVCIFCGGNRRDASPEDRAAFAREFALQMVKSFGLKSKGQKQVDK